MINIINNQILFNNNLVLFFVKNNDNISYLSFEDVLISKTDCGYEFSIEQECANVSGIMIPSVSHTLVSQKKINPSKTRRYYYNTGSFFQEKYNWDKFDVNIISTPIVHFIIDDNAYSWSCPHECFISNFLYLYKPYVSIEAASGRCTFYLDVSSNYVINSQRYPVERKAILITKHTGLVSIKKAILYGLPARILPNKPNNIIETARLLQRELFKHNIKSVIIGSLARRLNNLLVDVQDIDIMVSKEDFNTASIELSSICDELGTTPNRVKLSYGKIAIDLCSDNYNILPGSNFFNTRHGITFLSSEGLMWLYHMDLFSACNNEYSEDFFNHVMDALFSLYQSAPINEFGLIPDTENLDNYTKKSIELCSELHSAVQEFRDIRVNEPFEIRSFRKDNTVILSIVNHGSPNDIQVVVDFIPEKVLWKDIGGNTQNVVIENHENFCLLYAKNLHLPGIMKCRLKEEKNRIHEPCYNIEEKLVQE